MQVSMVLPQGLAAETSGVRALVQSHRKAAFSEWSNNEEASTDAKHMSGKIMTKDTGYVIRNAFKFWRPLTWFSIKRIRWRTTFVTNHCALMRVSEEREGNIADRDVIKENLGLK
jgi:hypothetical protein